MSENPNTQSGAERLAKELDGYADIADMDGKCQSHFAQAATAIRALAAECEKARAWEQAYDAGDMLAAAASYEELQKARATTDALALLGASNG